MLRLLQAFALLAKLDAIGAEGACKQVWMHVNGEVVTIENIGGHEMGYLVFFLSVVGCAYSCAQTASLWTHGCCDHRQPCTHSHHRLSVYPNPRPESIPISATGP